LCGWDPRREQATVRIQDGKLLDPDVGIPANTREVLT
jgi:hypothetical protein